MIVKIAILGMALGCYAFSNVEETKNWKGGEMVVILDRSTPVQLVLNACSLKNNDPKRLVVEDCNGNKIFEQWNEGTNITISTQSWPSGLYTVKLDKEGCQQRIKVKLTK